MEREEKKKLFISFLIFFFSFGFVLWISNTQVPLVFLFHVSSTSTWNLSLRDLSCYSELEFKRLKMLVF